MEVHDRRQWSRPSPRSSVQFSSSVVSDSLWHHGLQHARPPCPSPAPGAYSNSCLSSLWCHPTISFPVVPFPSLQSFPASGSFPVSQFFPSGGQSIGVSASASVLPMNIQDWFPLGLTGWISLQFKEILLKYCKIYPCKVCNSVVFNILTVISNNTNLRIFLSPPKEVTYTLAVTSHFHSSPSPGSH